MKKILLKLFMVTSVILSMNLSAELIDNGNYTSDTETGIDWLDLTETKGLSYAFVLSHFGSGGQFEGWSYATREQINVFMTNAGFVKGLKTSSNIVPISRLLNLWGTLSLRSSKEIGDRSKFLHGATYRVDLPKKNSQRAYVGSIEKTGEIGKERGLVLLNNIQSSLSINESNDKTGSALIRIKQ